MAGMGGWEREKKKKKKEGRKVNTEKKEGEAKKEGKKLAGTERGAEKLIIRLSAAKVDGNPGNAWSHSSTVVTDGAPSCKSGDQGGKCLDCRACWNKDIKNISYGKH